MTMLKPLNRQTAAVQTLYPERIVQFGGGNFLRGFVDWMVEELNQQAGFASSVVVVKPTPQGSYDQFNLQNGLFHLRMHGLQDGKLVTTRKLITCISRAVNPYSDYEAYKALARQPEIRFVVSNTTESGLTFAPEDKLTDAPPSSFPAKLTVFLYERFQHFQASPDKGCIILPCELVEQNGERLKQLILQYADLWGLEAGFKQWIENSNQFCDTLVDRIVPGFPKNNGQAVLEEVGFDDQLLVEAEQYHSWVIQAPQSLKNEFPVDQTNLNVRIVDDVNRYREIKVRILNGSHTAMTPIGYLMGLETVRQAVEHPWLGQFVRDLLFTEIIPTFKDSDPELEAFARDVLIRFQNPFIHHLLMSIALNSISKFKVRLVQPLVTYTDKYHKLPKRIVFAFAALIRFYKGEWNGTPIPLKDDLTVIDWFGEQWHSTVDIHKLVEKVLSNTALWEQDLTQVDGLVELLSSYLAKIEMDGIQAAIEGQDWSQ